MRHLSYYLKIYDNNVNGVQPNNEINNINFIKNDINNIDEPKYDTFVVIRSTASDERFQINWKIN